ncbi:hypothetical protein K474DRAFT_632780 [Panus rudis PR-1116 ss-1]|nr:hypothetical protein K474DRAFT_632780 [Panus rudis PR-1116 ss-1]
MRRELLFYGFDHDETISTDLTIPISECSKREYLLAQIRQKDLVIESLLKQLHDPYLATPLSIDSFKQATSPSDRNKQNVMEWLERMQASVKNAGTSAGIKAFKLDSRTLNSNSNALDGGDESDEESNRDVTERGTVVGHGEGGVGASGSGVGGGGGGGGGGEEDGEKLYTLPEDTVPFGLLARLSLANQKKKAREEREKDKIDETDDNDVGVANDAYFAPGPSYDLNIRANMIEQHSLPEIIVHGLVTADDVNKLFEIFYARLNSHVSLLDPVLHDAKSTFTRCPFLFTVICAISSRFYEEKSEIYPIAMHFAKHAAANALISGWKSVELAQAYLLLSIYGVPAKRWEDDRSWLYIGLAIRLATDLNLQHVPTTKPATERQEREILNRTRTWINLYNLDRSLSTQYGKPYSIKEDYIIRTSNNWYNKSKYNHPLDVSLCGYNALLQIVSRFHEEVYSDPDNPSGLNMRLDFRRLAGEYDERLNAYETEWRRRYEEGTDLNDRACALRLTLLPFVTFYARLVMYSFAFQHALRRGLQPEDKPVIDKCYEYAMGVVNGMVNELAPTGYMRYSPDGYFVFATFASGFLLKLLRREFTLFISIEQQDQIFDSIGTLIYTLNTPEIAMDDRHTPRLHARFLASLLSRHRRNVAPATATQQQNPPQGQVHGGTPGQHSSASGSSSHSSGSSQVYSSTSTQGSMQGQHGMGTTHSSPQAEPPMDTAAIESNFLFGGSVVDTSELGSALSATYTDDMLPGALQFFKNEAYWQNALMPGFPWPETRGYDAMQTAHGFASGFVAQPVPAATYS